MLQTGGETVRNANSRAAMTNPWAPKTRPGTLTCTFAKVTGIMSGAVPNCAIHPNHRSLVVSVLRPSVRRQHSGTLPLRGARDGRGGQGLSEQKAVGAHRG
jgi:hypothetical protein